MRPRARMNCWRCVVIGLVLVVCCVSSPVRASLSPVTPVFASFPSRDVERESMRSGPALTSATFDPAFADPGDSDFDEEDEFKTFWSDSRLGCFEIIPLVPSSRFLSWTGPDHSRPGVIALPLRC